MIYFPSRVAVHCKKRLTIFPARESLVSDIPAGDGEIVKLFLQCKGTPDPALLETGQVGGPWICPPPPSLFFSWQPQPPPPTPTHGLGLPNGLSRRQSPVGTSFTDLPRRMEEGL
jgi:hypothetical protein